MARIEPPLNQCGQFKMHTQKILAALVLVLAPISFTVSAAIINPVDFPDSFVQEKNTPVTQEQVNTTVDAKK